MRPFEHHGPTPQDYCDLVVGPIVVVLAIVLVVKAEERTAGGILWAVGAVVAGLLLTASGWMGTPDDRDRRSDTRRLRSFKSAIRWTVYAPVYTFLGILRLFSRI